MLPRTRLIALLLSLAVSMTVLYYLQRNAEEVLGSFSQVVGKTGAYIKGSDSNLDDGGDVDPPPQQPPYGAVVAAARADADISWLTAQQFQKDWIIYPYNINLTTNPDERLNFPMNKGHEAMIYLTHLVRNYDSLPWMTVFTHGHYFSWHQEAPINRLINTLNRTVLAREGYINLRCDWYPACPAELRPYRQDSKVWGPGVRRKETELAMYGNWRQIFPAEKLPETIATQCCAQFAVTRNAVRRRPRKDYERMREWLVGTLLTDDVSGRVFEKLWAYIFTGKAVHCPPPQRCACAYFGRCEEKTDWPKPPSGLPDPRYPDWPW